MKPGVVCIVLALLAAPALGCGDGAARSAGPSPAARKTFAFARLQAHKSLDPVRQFDSASADLVRNLYDRLLDYAYLARPFALEPNLAAKLPELSADGLRYSFELRKGVRFHDDPCFPQAKGRALTADDVIYSFHRFADANVNALSYSLMQGMVKGMDEFREQTRQRGAATDYDQLRISGITKQDDHRFTIELTRANPLALLPLAATQLSIVAREAVAHYKQDFEHHPVGSGAFSLKTYSRRGSIVLVRNRGYHLRYPSQGSAADSQAGRLRAAGRALPLVDEIHLPLIEEAQPRMLKFLSGQLDWVPFDRDNFSSMAFKDETGVHLKPQFAGKFRVYAEPDLRIDGIRFNMKDPLLGKNKPLRQAIATALDTRAFLKLMYDGRGEVLKTVVPLGIPGSERDVRAEGHVYDPERVMQKLALAGYPQGKGLPPLTIEYRAATTQTRAHFEFKRDQLAKFGIELRASFQSFSGYLQKAQSGAFQILDFGWGADYPDAENFYQLLYSENRAPGSNYGSYDNPEYDRLFRAARFMANGPERYALFARMNAIIHEDAPMALLWNLTRVGLYQRWVENFKYHPLLEVPFQYLGIDPALKAKGL